MQHCLLEDPQGAVFSLINTVNGDPETQQTDNGWIWQEVWSDNPEQSKAFYQSLGNYSAQSKPLKNGNYSYLIKWHTCDWLCKKTRCRDRQHMGELH